MIKKLLIIFCLFALVGCTKNSTTNSSINLNLNDKTMDYQSQIQLSSPAFENFGKIPKKYTCDGENINPPLDISNIPPEAKSLALIVDDPDAPSGTWTHWLLWNIPPQTSQIKEDSFPDGSIEGTTSFDNTGWGGPCPPSGTHDYEFKIFALDTKLNLPFSTDQNGLMQAIEEHIIGYGELIGTYR